MQGSEELPGGARAQPSALGLGERLRSARKARALTVSQVAERLRLEESTVVALEEGRFEKLGAAVFIRGHLKRYAELVGLSTTVVLEAYQSAAPESASPPALARPRETVERVNLRLWGLWVVIPILILGVIVYALRGSPENDGGSEPAASAPAAADTAVVSGPAATPAPAPTMPAEPTPEAAMGAEPAMPATPPPAEASSTVSPEKIPAVAAAATARSRLELRFTEDAWVNVSDSEHRLLYGLQRQASRQELTGKLPFHLMLSNARAVTLKLDGKTFAVPAEAVADNVAHFDIPAPAGAHAE